MMRTICGAAMVLSAGIGAAEARPDVRKMTCAAANDLVLQEGAVVMTTGTHTFQRFVASERYCRRRDEILRTAIVPSRDNPKCQLRSFCDQSGFNGRSGFRF